jgi:hypothetical protein
VIIPQSQINIFSFIVKQTISALENLTDRYFTGLFLYHQWSETISVITDIPIWSDVMVAYVISCAYQSVNHHD